MAEANSTVGAAAVRTVRVLPVGGVPAPPTTRQAPVPAVASPDAVPVQARVKTREMALSGFPSRRSPRTRPSRPSAVSTRRSRRRWNG
ncbi:hypothetical protein ACFXD5_23535 [Streptomyces sp. NPDC059385]|uniref:hypothetical protein n=1 Tax=Streptomyces sp. NPDC059385 TaxID=3346817 RepID=UPI0036872D17